MLGIAVRDEDIRGPYVANSVTWPLRRLRFIGNIFSGRCQRSQCTCCGNEFKLVLQSQGRINRKRKCVVPHHRSWAGKRTTSVFVHFLYNQFFAESPPVTRLKLLKFVSVQQHFPREVDGSGQMFVTWREANIFKTFCQLLSLLSSPAHGSCMCITFFYDKIFNNKFFSKPNQKGCTINYIIIIIMILVSTVIKHEGR